MKNEKNNPDTRLLLPLALLHDACRVAPCFSWEDCDLFRDIGCSHCPTMDAINFIEKGNERQ